MKMNRACYVCHMGLIALATVIALVPECASAQQSGVGGTVSVADGTPIHLVLMDDLQGKKLQVNQVVHLKVREDLTIGSTAIVKTGAEAIGHIESISKNGLLGKSGRLVLQFDYVTAVSGIKIPLRGGAGVSGGKGGALTTISALWYGPDASMPVGTMINAFVSQNQQILLPQNRP